MRHQYYGETEYSRDIYSRVLWYYTTCNQNAILRHTKSSTVKAPKLTNPETQAILTRTTEAVFLNWKAVSRWQRNQIELS